jgi:putative aminopeptidase FrvX
MSPKISPNPQAPTIGAAQVNLLEKLCNACAVSGDEGEVRKIVLDQVRPYADEVKVDSLGNVLVKKAGKSESRLKVMLAAHMDEVGFMLTHEEEDGSYRFENVGGIDVRQLAGKPVWIGHEHIPGVIGVKPIHLTTMDERTNTLRQDALRIDTGIGKNHKIKPGDRATFATSFRRLGANLRAKALDNRLGVATLIELVKNSPTNIDLLAAFTVQEEVGLRGARVAAYTLNPDLAFVLDSTPANDLPAWDGSENPRYNTRLGAGAAIYLADSATLSDPRLVRFLTDTAEKAGIPYQIRQPGGGGTDAGSIHKQRTGIPSVSISVPGRYPHTSASIARVSDWKSTLALVYQALCDISPAILATDR